MNASADSAYVKLTDRFARIATLGEAAAMLGWDAAAMMPPGGGCGTRRAIGRARRAGASATDDAGFAR